MAKAKARTKAAAPKKPKVPEFIYVDGYAPWDAETDGDRSAYPSAGAFAAVLGDDALAFEYRLVRKVRIASETKTTIIEVKE